MKRMFRVESLVIYVSAKEGVLLFALAFIEGLLSFLLLLLNILS